MSIKSMCAGFRIASQEEVPLRRVAREIDSHGGYLRELGVTAILVMPLNEVGRRIRGDMIRRSFMRSKIATADPTLSKN